VKSGKDALAFCGREKPDLVLLDVDMPEMNGFETIGALKSIQGMEDIPVVFLTGNIDEETEIRALELGARDFITKPVDKNILIHRIELHLKLHEYQTNLNNAMRDLENSVMVSFADLVERKDSNTGQHVLRTRNYLEKLGRELLDRGAFPGELSEESLELMVRATPFHDIGKIGVSDVILQKNGKLTKDEYEEVKLHTIIGAKVLENIHKRTPSQCYFILAKLMAEGHHERFDGKGYPYGLKGNDIPLCCRLMSVANVFDACMTERNYRPALSYDEACDVIESGSGTEFDPIVVEAFKALKGMSGGPMKRRPKYKAKPTAPGAVKKKVLAVDDNISSLKGISVIMSGIYDYSLATSGAQALDFCAGQAPDLILLDVEMPDMNGFETIAKLKENPLLNHIPIIFLTGNRDVEAEIRGLVSGAVDFIKKPVGRNILLHRLDLHLNIASYQSYLADSVKKMADSLSTSIADLIECRDQNTGGHVVRTSKYVELLERELFSRGFFKSELSDAALEMALRAAPLHDIGKISISDKILLKPGRLDDEEFAVMKKHAEIGAEILEIMFKRTPTQTYLRYACLIAASHHERYDGMGYPKGLAGENIPLCGRIMAVADVYDALVDDRVYRKGMSHEDAYSIIMEGKGSQFDPRVVEAFECCQCKFAEMASQLSG
jgi:putative two-component system response regulator